MHSYIYPISSFIIINCISLSFTLDSLFCKLFYVYIHAVVLIETHFTVVMQLYFSYFAI